MTSLTHPRLSGLGCNPMASDDVLVRLAAHGAGRHGVEQRDGLLADVVVEALLTHGGSDSGVLMRRSLISPEMRRRIASHSDRAIRDAYADFIRSMVDLGVPLPIDALEEAYGEPPRALAGAPDPKLRAAVAQSWWERPAEAQVNLLADPDPQVRAAATAREEPGVPPEWWDRCLADPATRANVARRVPLTWEQFLELTREGDDEDLRQAVAANPHLTADMVARLLDVDDPVVRIALAHSRHVDAKTRDSLYAHVEGQRADGSIEAEVALSWNPARPVWLSEAPLAERLTYVDCRHVAFRLVLAACRDLPQEAWRRLDDDPDLQVRRTAARRPDAPPEVLERLVRAHGDVFHLSPLLVEHPNFPRQTLRTLADAPDPHVRYVALQDPELPAPALERLAVAEESFVRSGVARHPNITDTLLERLLSDPDPEVVHGAAANPALRPERMYRILTDAGL
ncbi:hypothetical protein [Actinacidiphila glaucinigra]|uniref:hypothetical protein n=1 Tax=Actinacidiphila glaucinigra TaxID=235986 RepID=UPI0035DF59B9